MITPLLWKFKSFILAGRDTTSEAMTWFFWLLYKNPAIESGVVKEIEEKSYSPIYDEVKDMGLSLVVPVEVRITVSTTAGGGIGVAAYGF
ncbi:hypothetical protein L2E82_08410 [Cichorium intybus]|uniref:Uncharacterized protein n=1 Tax=Cichorium intybus TaxID=13427 RepID=A0ACB9G7G9_CICIN|nr:hypothetical protein L2E82_08410 [Cichorium intybus]